MDRKSKPLFAISILLILIAGVLSGCGASSEIVGSVDQGPVFAAHGMPKITVDREEAFFTSDDTVVLRAATGIATDGTDLSQDIKVVLLDAMSKEVFTGTGNTEQTVMPLSGGTYIAVYTLEQGGLVTETSYCITVIASELVLPVIEAPSTDARLFTGQPIRLSSARAFDKTEGDVSSWVKVHVEDASGRVVFAEKNADQTYTYTPEAPGEYKVVYTCKNMKGKAAEPAGYAVTVMGTTASGIVLDGKITETEYAAIPAYRTGLGGNIVFYFHQDEEYLYIAANVKDTTLTAYEHPSPEMRLNTSDGIELLFNPENNTQLNAKGTKCLRIRIGADGSVLTYTPSQNGKSWQDAKLNMQGNFAVATDGTFSYAGKTKATDASAADPDAGYTIETRIPWKHLGYAKNPMQSTAFSYDYIGVAFGHRDVSSPQYYYAYMGTSQSGSAGQNNTFYNGMHYIGRDEVATGGLCPLYYPKLYLRGESLGVNPVVYTDDILLDGYMEDTFWSDATVIPYGKTGAGAEVDARIKTDAYGIYIGVYIEDGQMVAEPRSFHGSRGIKFNDRLDLRILDENSLTLTALPKAVSGKTNITNGKILFMDPLGSAQMHMLQAASGRGLAQLPFAYATMTNGTVGYSKNGNLWNSEGEFIADTDIGDIDRGWGVEVFLPWSTIGMQYPEAGKTAKIGILVSILDRNADSLGAVITNSSISQVGRAHSVISSPDSYYVIEIAG